MDPDPISIWSLNKVAGVKRCNFPPIYLLTPDLKVGGNKKQWGSGRSQMLGNGLGPWRSRFINNLNTQLLNKKHISFSALSSKTNTVSDYFDIQGCGANNLASAHWSSLRQLRCGQNSQRKLWTRFELADFFLVRVASLFTLRTFGELINWRVVSRKVLFDPHHFLSNKSPIHFAGENGKGNTVRFSMANGFFKIKMDIDRHGPRRMPDNCKNLNPPYFSLPSTFNRARSMTSETWRYCKQFSFRIQIIKKRKKTPLFMLIDRSEY